MFKTKQQQLPETVKRECPVYLFVRWKPGVRKWGQPTSTYNGNKWVEDDDLGKMIINLIKILEKEHSKVALALIYDNRIPKYDRERDIVKINNGVIEVNALKKFESAMHGFQLPEWLK